MTLAVDANGLDQADADRAAPDAADLLGEVLATFCILGFQSYMIFPSR